MNISIYQYNNHPVVKFKSYINNNIIHFKGLILKKPDTSCKIALLKCIEYSRFKLSIIIFEIIIFINPEFPSIWIKEYLMFEDFI